MSFLILRSSRRAFLGAIAGGLAACVPAGVFAEELTRTPPMTEGPFYPDVLPLDTDNDLIIVNDALTPAVGEITHLTGRILGPNGDPIKNATIEIWQCDAKEVYLHTSDSGPKSDQRDGNFQGFGRFTTGSTGAYYFRTIKPVPYPGRPAPHIHVKIKKGSRELLTTQFGVYGHPGNEVDGVFAGARDLIDRELLFADFKTMADSKIGELTAKFDVVLGKTPTEAALHQLEDSRRKV